jgi:site-specific recombinase XerD
VTPIAPTLQAFFSDRLTKQLQASPRTIASYRDTLRLLLCFAQDTTGTAPSALDWDELDEPLIAAFLEHLELERHNSARTRNLRLTAIRSLFRYAAVRHPEHAAVIARVLSIPAKRHERRAVTFLTAEESQALIDAPRQDRWEGRRDRAMLILTLQAGLRVSELVAVNRGDVALGTGGHVRVEGKGRKQRTVPLTKGAKAVLTAWLAERGGQPRDPLFPTRTGRRLSRDAVERRVATHVTTATKQCASLQNKRVHPHVLRHSCAMSLLRAGVDSTVIALWLGHADIRSTQPYVHADMTIKERALAVITPASVAPGRYTPSDVVLAYLDSLG